MSVVSYGVSVLAARQCRCGKRLRPCRASKEDFPGTVIDVGRGMCAVCNRAGKKRASVAGWVRVDEGEVNVVYCTVCVFTAGPFTDIWEAREVRADHAEFHKRGSE